MNISDPGHVQASLGVAASFVHGAGNRLYDVIRLSAILTQVRDVAEWVHGDLGRLRAGDLVGIAGHAHCFQS